MAVKTRDEQRNDGLHLNERISWSTVAQPMAVMASATVSHRSWLADWSQW